MKATSRLIALCAGLLLALTTPAAAQQKPLKDLLAPLTEAGKDDAAKEGAAKPAAPKKAPEGATEPKAAETEAPPEAAGDAAIPLEETGPTAVKTSEGRELTVAQTIPFDQRRAEWIETLDAARAALTQGGLREAGLDLLQTQLIGVRDSAQAAAKAASPKLADAERLLAKLGPPPAEGETEPADAAAEREKLNALVGEVRARISGAQLEAARAERILRDVSAARRALLTAELTTRGVSSLDPVVWRLAMRDLAQLPGQFAVLWDLLRSDDYKLEQWRELRPRLALGIVLALAIGIGLRVLLRRKFGQVRPAPVEGANYTARVITAAVDAFARSLVWFLLASVLYVGLIDSGFLLENLGPLTIAAGTAILGGALIIILARSTLTPRRPEWRVLPFDDAAASRLAALIAAMAVVVGIDLFLLRADEITGRSLDFIAVVDLTTSTAFAVLVLAALSPRIWSRATPTAAVGETDEESEAEPSGEWFSWGGLLRLLIAMVILAVPIVSALGYQELSRFIGNRLTYTAVFLAVLLLAHMLASEAMGSALKPAATDPGRPTQRAVRKMREQSAESLRFWSLLAVDGALVVAALIAMPLLWGFHETEVKDWVRQALFGFKVGSFTLSLTDIALGILVFFVVLGGTHLIQRVLEIRIFPQTKLDIGVRSSVKTAIGYVGLTLAAILAVSMVGVDFSNLAIIAGALSVGIGFGLQAIVNNFVSGLILLAERPIKVGDWVEIGTVSGFVRRIMVRATEIETFQKATVIVPNSEVLQQNVSNWVLKDRQARIEVPVGVSYNTDLEQAREVLLDVAREHPMILPSPPPSVMAMNFGDSSVDLELRAFIRDAEFRMSTSSDLRFAIHKKFKETGIEIPFPQRVLHDATAKAEAAEPAEEPEAQPVVSLNDPGLTGRLSAE